jgi:hypothetical protein
MKSVSKFALAFALASISITGAAQAQTAEKPKKEKPAKEKKGKEQAPAAVKLALSKEFNAAYSPVVNAYVKSKDAVAAAAGWGAIKAAIKNEDDRYQAGIFGSQIGRESKNAAMSAEALELVLASTSTPADQRSIYTFQKAATAYDAKDWANAETWLIKAHAAGYKSTSIPGGVEVLISDALEMQKKFPESLDWRQKSIDASKAPGAIALPDNFYARAANIAIKSGQTPLVAKWLKELVRVKPTPDYWHDALMQTYKVADLDTQEVLDLMRLLRSVGGMKYEQNYAAYATDALIAFFPTEMKSVLDEGFAKGTITKANATFGGRYREAEDKLKLEPFSLKVLDQDIASAKTGAASAFAGDIALSVGEYARAKGAYETALASGKIADKEGKDLSERTRMRLGIAKLKLGDLVGAKAEFAKITSPNRKAVADYWALYVEQMENGVMPKPA